MKKYRHVRPFSGALGGLIALALLAGCNQHPLEALEESVTSVNRQENRLPAKTKLDFLFVIDNSGSMCEEQTNLTANFRLFSQFLAQELGASADYRIAVTSTDMNPENRQRGSFLADPALPVPSLNCRNPLTNEPNVPDTADCQQLLMNGELQPVIKSGIDGNIGQNCDANPDPSCVQDDLERKFSCLASLGVQGDGFEKGLEAMRVALSCSGPNRASFGTCCVEVEARGRREARYNPACVIGENEDEPDFLRPDAVLVVIFVADEDDCSDPITNPAESQRVICRYDLRDADSDGVPDGYNDRELCGTRSPAECFRAECGALSAEECRSKRCEIPRTENNACEWFRSDLTPVQDYYRFLNSLKPNPADQIVVATIVGQRAYTPSGFEIDFNMGVSGIPECRPINDMDDREVLNSDMCCPTGNCSGAVRTSCESVNGKAFSGRRYLQLAEQFGINGIGCAPPPQGLADDDTRIVACNGQALDADCNYGDENQMNLGKCRPVPGVGRLACTECVTICEDNFARPLEAIKEKVAQFVASYCLDKPAACQITEEDGSRPCETAEELGNAANYPIRVRQQCLLTEDQGGVCQVEVPPTVLARDQWTLELNRPNCKGGMLVQLDDPPPAGAEVFIEFLVEVGGGQAAQTDGGAPPSPVDAAAP